MNGLPQWIGSFGETQTGLSFALGFPFWFETALGIGVQQYINKLDTESAQSTGISLGLIKKWGDSFLMGVSIHNLSLLEGGHASIQWSTGHRDYFPLRITSSIAWMQKIFAFQTEWYLDAQTTELAENAPMLTTYSGGSLIWFIPKTMNVMLGYKQDQASIGFGLFLSSFSLNYAFIHHPVLGGNHMISLGLNL